MFKYDEIRLRAVEKKDLDFLYNLRIDEAVNEQLFNVMPISMFKQEEWLSNMLKNSTYKVLIVENISSLKSLGCIRLKDIDYLNGKVEIGVDIDEDYRGMGWGKKTYEALIKYCFNYLNMQKIYLYVFENNERAVTLYQKLEFEVEGVLKRHIYRNGYKTVLLMSRFRD